MRPSSSSAGWSERPGARCSSSTASASTTEPRVAVLLRYTDAAGGESWVDQVKAVMRERDGHDDGLDLSVSAGVATAPPQESLNAAFAEADRLMYAVKPPER